MKQLSLAFALLASIGLAQAASHEHDMHHDVASNETHATMHLGIGVIKEIKSGKVQIAHEPIPTLDWPAMTMWFDLKTPAGTGIKVGDRVNFEMIQDENKKWAIVGIKRK